jgi:hypothetical protein
MPQSRIHHNVRARLLTQLQPLIPRIDTHDIHPERPRKLHPQMAQSSPTPHNRKPLTAPDARNLDAAEDGTPRARQGRRSRKAHALR